MKKVYILCIEPITFVFVTKVVLWLILVTDSWSCKGIGNFAKDIEQNHFSDQ